MQNMKKDLEKLEALHMGRNCTINWFEEGGGIVYNCNGVYVLFEVGAYGGYENYCGTYQKDELEQVVLIASGWT